MRSLLIALTASFAAGFTPAGSNWVARRSLVSLDAKVVTIFGSSSGSTEDVADSIVEQFGDDAEPAVNIDDVVGKLAETFSAADCLVVGTPTYNTDADSQRSATSWDAVYYSELKDLAASGALKGKPVAVFGLGDQEGYGENFADACGELFDVFEAAGCRMFGMTAVDDSYEFEASKSVRGDKFIGLVCDAANQDDLTEGRVAQWVAQLKEEGFTGTGAAAPAPPPPAAAAPAAQAAMAAYVGTGGAPEMQASALGCKDWQSSCTVEEEEEFVPFYSPIIGQTLWVSTKDHRKSYYTFDKKK